MLPPDFLPRLKERADIVSIIGKRISLRQKGREFEACCPFHNEKTPSFTVSPQKNFYYCFGCGAKGDALTFIMEHDRQPFMDAVKTLAAESGMEVPAPSPQAAAKAKQAAGLTDIMQQAANFYQDKLQRSGAWQYLIDRGLTQETIKKFQLGYAPDGWENLKSTISNNESQLLEAGMLSKNDAGRVYDRFRSRLMFPITNASSKVIAFGGRVLNPDDAPKYLNSPETPLFNKSETLYGISTLNTLARNKNNRGQDQVLIVEGYMDVIAVQQAGLAALAPLGTALTELQLEKLWRRFDTPIMCFDGDAAGVRAAKRALERALPILKPGKSLAFLTLPEGEDPDTIVKQHGGNFLRQLMQRATPLLDYLFNIYCNPIPTQPEEKAAALYTMQELAQQIPDKTLANLYKEQLKDKFYKAVRAAKQSNFSASIQNQNNNFAARNTALQRDKSGGIVAAVINHPNIIDDIAEEFSAISIKDPILNKIREQIFLCTSSNPDITSEDLLKKLDTPELHQTVSIILSQKYLCGNIFAMKNTSPENTISTIREYHSLNNYPLRKKISVPRGQ